MNRSIRSHGIRIQFFYLSEKFDAGHPGHALVRNDNTDFVLRQDFQSLLAAIRVQNFVTIVPEQASRAAPTCSSSSTSNKVRSTASPNVALRVLYSITSFLRWHRQDCPNPDIRGSPEQINLRLIRLQSGTTNAPIRSIDPLYQLFQSGERPSGVVITISTSLSCRL